MCLFLMIKMDIADARVRMLHRKIAGSIPTVPQRSETMWQIFRGLVNGDSVARVGQSVILPNTSQSMDCSGC